jgi:uncharacterized protein YerC
MLDDIENELQPMVSAYKFHQHQLRKLTPRRVARETGISHATIAKVFSTGKASRFVRVVLQEWWDQHKGEFVV